MLWSSSSNAKEHDNARTILCVTLQQRSSEPILWLIHNCKILKQNVFNFFFNKWFCEISILILKQYNSKVSEEQQIIIKSQYLMTLKSNTNSNAK